MCLFFFFSVSLKTKLCSYQKKKKSNTHGVTNELKSSAVTAKTFYGKKHDCHLTHHYFQVSRAQSPLHLRRR